MAQHPADLTLLTAFSLLAFGRLARTNRETVWHYEVDPRQGQSLRQVYHCERDHIAFDARQYVLSANKLHRRLERTAS